MKNGMNLVVFLFSLHVLSAQVGIGTTNPQADLEVKGNTIVQKKLQTGTLPFVQPTDANFNLLTRVKNSQPNGKVAVLDVDRLEVAPVNVINYKFIGINKDNLSDVNLQYDANRYIVGMANFRYVGDPMDKEPVGNTFTIGAFVTRTFISNDTWHLEIRNRFLDLAEGKTLSYYVTLIIYDKSYYRNLPEIETDLGGNNTGTASATPNLY